MIEQQKAPRDQQRAARDKHHKDIEESIDKASKLVEDSRREIQRSRDLSVDHDDGVLDGHVDVVKANNTLLHPVSDARTTPG
jgi:hypothetical protein